MIPLNDSVLLRRMWTGALKFDPLFIIKLQHVIRGKLTAIVEPDLLNIFVKLIIYHSVKIHQVLTSFMFKLQQKNPNSSTEIVNYSKKITYPKCDNAITENNQQFQFHCSKREALCCLAIEQDSNCLLKEKALRDSILVSFSFEA